MAEWGGSKASPPRHHDREAVYQKCCKTAISCRTPIQLLNARRFARLALEAGALSKEQYSQTLEAQPDWMVRRGLRFRPPNKWGSCRG